MKRKGFIVLCLAALAASSFSAETLCGHALSSLKRLTAPAPANLRLKTETWDATDVLSNNVDIDVIPVSGTISGSNTMTIKALENSLSEFTFRLSDNFTISSVTLNGAPITFTRLDPINVRANLSPAVALNQNFALKITYSGVGNAGNGFGSFEFGTRASGAQFAFTLSEPYYSYTWWPSKDDNTDKALNAIAVTVPNGLKVAANGLQTATTPVGGTKTKHSFVCTYPMADYLLMFSTTLYNEWSLTFNYAGGSMPVRFMIYPENDSTANRNAWGAVVPMLGTFESIYGPYPFRNDQYGIYNFSFSGGMEHQTFTGQGGFSESLCSHELAHQWWGDMVTCATWSDIWLNEGFATYSEALWLENKPGSTGLAALKTAMAARRPSADTGSVYRYDTSSTGAIFSSTYAYRKGAWVLHMLRHVVGDAQFTNILQAWRTQYGYQSGTTADFKNVAEGVVGYDLDTFFEQWVMQPGAPNYRRSFTTTTVNGKSYMLLRIEQTQNTTYPTYRMPIDVNLGVNANPTLTKIENFARSQYYVIPFTGTAGALTLDPDTWIFVRTHSTATYAPGPPKIVEISPRPGPFEDLFVRDFRVTFHTPVNVTVADFILETSTGQPIGFSLNYNAATNTAIITPAEDVDAAGLKLTVKDTITAQNSGQALDGEVASPFYKVPSGDGIAGGSAIFTFSY